MINLEKMVDLARGVKISVKPEYLYEEPKSWPAVGCCI